MLPLGTKTDFMIRTADGDARAAPQPSPDDNWWIEIQQAGQN
jgi:hypothetical protein